MGEYALRKSDRQSIKIGTCDDMYYLRYEDQDKVVPESGSDFGTRWRIPFPDEDHILPGDYDSGFRQVDLVMKIFRAEIADDCKHYQEHRMVHYNPPEEKYQGCKFYRLDCIRYLRGSLYPVVCGYESDEGDRWSYSERFRDNWINILPYIEDEDLKLRLLKYL